MKPDYSHYITNQIMKPVTQIFNLLLEQMSKFNNKTTKALYDKDLRIVNGKYSNDENKLIDANEQVSFSTKDSPGNLGITQDEAKTRLLEAVERYSSLKTSHSIIENELNELSVEVLGPITREMRKLLEDKTYLEEILNKGGEKANIIAKPILKCLKRLIFSFQPICTNHLQGNRPSIFASSSVNIIN